MHVKIRNNFVGSLSSLFSFKDLFTLFCSLLDTEDGSGLTEGCIFICYFLQGSLVPKASKL